MKLLEDVFIIENLQIINEGAGSGPMKIRGCFQRADEANNNKRIYRKPLLEREISKLAEAMTERRLMGELDHPQNDSVKLSNVSHLITDLKMKGNELVGEAEILDTPSGKVAKALIDGGVKIGVSSRGMGTVTEEMDGKRYVNEDFKLITWDIVADPSTRGAFPGLTESTQIQEIIDTVYPEAQKVKNFTTLLKEELTVESTPAGRRRSKKIGTEAAREIAALEPAPGFPIDEPEAGKQDDIRASAIKRGGTEVRRGRVRVRTQVRRQKLGLNPGQTTRGRESLGLGGGDAALQQLRRSQSTNDSTQFINFMRDKLNEMKIAGKSSSTSTERTKRAISPKFKRAQGEAAEEALQKHKLKTAERKRKGPASTTDASVNLASSAKTKREQGLLAAVQRAGGVPDSPPVRTIIRSRSKKYRD